MIPKFDREPELGREGQRKLTVTRSTIPGLPVGADFTAEVNYDDGATVEGTPVNRATEIEYLAASGTTTGTASIFLLAQEDFELADGALIRVKFHTSTVAPFTINVNYTGAVPVHDTSGIDTTNYTANAWATFVYSATLNRWISQGGGGFVSLAGDTMNGTLVAHPNTQYTVAQVRNIMAGTADLTPGSSALASGAIYLVYE